jgi:hypothetical protein
MAQSGATLDEKEIIMKNQISGILVAGALILANITPAVAHEIGRNAYHQPVQYRTVITRSKSAPSWLRHNENFRSWYKHSALKKNRYLTWPELYQVYRWERPRAGRRYKKSYAYNGHHNYDWYRRYWSSASHRHSTKRYRRSSNRRDWDRHH